MNTWAIPKPEQPVKAELTPRQSEVLDFIASFSRERGYPPCRLDICVQFGWSSPNAAQEILVAMERKHWIALTPGVSRGIKIL